MKINDATVFIRKGKANNAHAHELLILAFCKIGFRYNGLGNWGCARQSAIV